MTVSDYKTEVELMAQQLARISSETRGAGQAHAAYLARLHRLFREILVESRSLDPDDPDRPEYSSLLVKLGDLAVRATDEYASRAKWSWSDQDRVS